MTILFIIYHRCINHTILDLIKSYHDFTDTVLKVYIDVQVITKPKSF